MVFTSGGTEANALALSGLGPIPLLVSAIEHDSVLKSAPHAHHIPVTGEGLIDLESLEKILSSFDKPGLLSLMLVNNETGVIQPLQEATRLAQLKGWKVHTDASQALGYIPFSFESLGVDMMTLSAHKCGGPVGIGALLLKEDLQLKPLISGGGQEYGMRSGTLVCAPHSRICSRTARSFAGRIYCFEASSEPFNKKSKTSLPDAIVYGKKSFRVSHVLCLGMPGISAELQLMAFDIKGIAISAGSACSSGKMKSSHVLAAMGVSPEASSMCDSCQHGLENQGR